MPCIEAECCTAISFLKPAIATQFWQGQNGGIRILLRRRRSFIGIGCTSWWMSQGMQSAWPRSRIEDSPLWLRAWSSRKATEAAKPSPAEIPPITAYWGSPPMDCKFAESHLNTSQASLYGGWKYVLRRMSRADVNNNQPRRLQPHINDSCAICVFRFDIAHEKPATVEEDVDGERGCRWATFGPVASDGDS